MLKPAERGVRLGRDVLDEEKAPAGPQNAAQFSEGGRHVGHVAAETHTPLCWFQHGIRPLWKAAADGCRPDRRTGAHLQQTGFSSITIDRFSIGVPPVSPHIMGTATK